MKTGVCGGIEKAPIIKALGFDYIEENMFRIASLSEQEFSERVSQYEKLDFPVYSFNNFFGGDISMYGENSVRDICAYATLALKRAHQLGGSVCVIGSGKARAIPKDMTRDMANRRFCDIVSACAELADQYGIRIAIEPLNHHETNYVNTVSEAAKIAKETGRENVGSLVDFFHFFMENERDDGVLKNASTLIHAHIARPNTDRRVPTAEDEKTVVHWASLLKEIGYKGALSIEARFIDFENDIRDTAKYMRLFQ